MVTKTRRIAGRESRPRARPQAREEPPLGPNVERRLTFIEQSLFWIGEFNRNDLVERFDVSMSQSSMDIARYLALGPSGVSYDKSSKRYVADDLYQPVLAKADLARFLGELRIVDQGLLRAADTLLGGVPPVATTPIPERVVDALTLRAIVRAIRRKRALHVRYQSMSRPQPSMRTIEPHALAYDGFRWHARAFDRESGTFRDFVIGRMTSPRLAEPAISTPESDIDWNAWVTLMIAPHPGLSAAQTRAIAADYGIRGRSTSMRVRRSLLFYALKRLGLDVDPSTRSPQDQHIVLANRKDIEAVLRNPAET